MQPVWVLSVDLQTKTATFQSGLGDAARAARGAFTDIKGGAGEMGRETGFSMMEARHSVMMLGEEFGVHLPRALAGFIASIGPIGAAMEAAFPFLAIAAGATILIEHLVKMHEAGEKLTEDQVKFGTAVQNAFNQLDEKLLQAQIRSDNLRNDHMGALRHELELIDRQSMAELVHSFEEVAKAADTVFEDLKVSWYQFGTGSRGAQHALTDFQNEYNNLLSKGKDEEASGLLRGTLSQAEKVLAMQKQAKDNDGGILSTPGPNADISLAMQAENELRKAGVGFTEKEIQAQQTLVDTLQSQVGMEGKIAALKQQDSNNAKTETAKDLSAQRSAAEKEAVDSQLRLGEMAVASDRATADAQLSIHHASIEERLASDIDFANRERDVQLAGNQAQIAALDKSSKDYQNQLQALKDKSLEITAQNQSQVSELQAKASQAINARDLTDLEQSEREKIEATRQGSEERIAAIDAAIKRTQSLHLEDSNFYRNLLTQRVQAVRQEAEEEGKLAEEAGKQQAQADLQSGERILAAHRQALQLSESLSRISMEREISDAQQNANLEFAIKQAALDKEIAALDKYGKDYQNKLKELQNQEKALTQQHEEELTNIRVQAELKRNQQVLSAEQSFNNLISQQLTQSIMGHQSFAQAMNNIGNQIATGMIQNAIKSMLADDMTKEKDAAYAARQAFKAGMHFPFPVNLVMAPVLAAGAFASVMAFAGGTDGVPGDPRSGDVVPSMLKPGEGVVPGGVMDGLSKVAKSGGFDKSPASHVHMHNTFHVNTIDGDGMQDALDKHADQLEKHVQKTLRRMNK